MVSKILITLGVVVYGLVIPFLEVNASHVFNETWPAHARLHEVWQLITNCTIGLLSLWLAWFNNQVHVASLLNMAVMGGVLLAHILSPAYGGTILSGNVQTTILGMELAVFAAVLVVVLAVIAFYQSSRRTNL